MHPLPTSLRRLFSRPYACSLTFHLGLALALGLGTVIGFPRTAEAAAADSDGRLVYFGTYTGKTSKGIYVSRLNPATGRLSVATVAAETTSPSFLAVDPKSRFLYAVNEISTFNGQAAGGVVGYSIERATGQLTLLNQQSSGGAGPCHLSVDATGQAVLVANYGGGSVSVLPIVDGVLRPASSFIQHQGSGLDRGRQEAPHAHGIFLDPANRFAFVPDLGQDKIVVYDFDPKAGSLKPHQPPFVAVAPASGPRHFTFAAGGKFAYVINEISCTVTAFRYDSRPGLLTEIETVSSLPLGQRVLSGYSTAELVAHPTGRFLYGSNRGHDTIAVFQVDKGTGKLSLVQHASTQGRMPRSFGIDPSGRWLLAANQDSATVVVFEIAPETGALRPTGQVLPVPMPVSVAFVP